MAEIPNMQKTKYEKGSGSELFKLEGNLAGA